MDRRGRSRGLRSGRERESLASIGATLPEPIPVAGGLDGSVGLLAWWLGATAATIALTMAMLGIYRRFELTVPTQFTAEQANRPVTARLFTAVTAGVTESILFQAYPIERIATLSGSLLVAAVVSYVLFTVAHHVGDASSLEETIYIGAPALAVTIVSVLSGSLYVIVLVHATVVALSLLSE